MSDRATNRITAPGYPRDADDNTTNDGLSFGYSADRLQLTSLSYRKNTTTLFSLSHGHTQSGGNNGQITSITDNVDNGRSVAYTYEALYRLKTVLTTGST